MFGYNLRNDGRTFFSHFDIKFKKTILPNGIYDENILYSFHAEFNTKK